MENAENCSEVAGDCSPFAANLRQEQRRSAFLRKRLTPRARDLFPGLVRRIGRDRVDIGSKPTPSRWPSCWPPARCLRLKLKTEEPTPALINSITRLESTAARAERALDKLAPAKTEADAWAEAWRKSQQDKASSPWPKQPHPWRAGSVILAPSSRRCCTTRRPGSRSSCCRQSVPSLAIAFKTDATGRLLYPEQVYAAPKKSGKTGFAALHMLCTVLLFGGRYAEGYALANDLEQAQSRVFQAISRIIEASPLLKQAATENLKDRITFSKVFGNASIAAIASDYAGSAGSNPTISVFDELWGFTSERSRRLWDEHVPPPTRKIACRLTVSYAGFENEFDLLQELYKRGLAQPEVGKDLRAGDGILMFWTHDPVAPWQTENWLEQMRRSLRANQFLRMIQNRFVTSESSFVDIEKWDACIDPHATPMISNPGLPVYVGVDASVKHDSTAIVAVAWDMAAQRARLVTHKVFQPSPDEPLDFEAHHRSDDPRSVAAFQHPNGDLRSLPDAAYKPAPYPCRHRGSKNFRSPRAT